MKNLKIILFIIPLFLSCKNSDVTPNDLVGTWYFAGVYNHRADYFVDYDKIDLTKVPVLQIENNTFSYSSQNITFKSNADLQTTNRHPQNLSISGTIAQSGGTTVFKNSNKNDSLIVNGLTKTNSFYVGISNKWLGLTLNFPNSNDDCLVFCRKK